MIHPTANVPMAGTWPLAIRLEVLPGTSILDRFEYARRAGFDAVELPGRFLADYREDLLASVNRLPLPVSSISLGFRHSLLSREAGHRCICSEDVAELLRLCRIIGASGLVMPPLLRGDCQDSFAPHGPGEASRAARDTLIIEQLEPLAKIAASENVGLWIEPVNHNETDYMTTLDHAAQISRRINHPSVGVVADLFHMLIDERDPIAALKASADQLSHVHISHSDRNEPRRDTPLLAEIFAALRAVGYGGYITIEARQLSGSPDQILNRCGVEMREMMRDASKSRTSR